MIDVALLNDFSDDCWRDVRRNGQLRCADPDILFNNAANVQVRKHCEAYAAPDRLLVFLPAMMSNSGRIHSASSSLSVPRSEMLAHASVIPSRVLRRSHPRSPVRPSPSSSSMEGVQRRCWSRAREGPVIRGLYLVAATALDGRDPVGNNNFWEIPITCTSAVLTPKTCTDSFTVTPTVHSAHAGGVPVMTSSTRLTVKFNQLSDEVS